MYEQLLAGEGCGIHLVAASGYLNGTDGTYAAAASAATRSEIAIGYQLASQAGDRQAGYGVRISPGQLDPIPLGPEDSLILISRKRP